MTYATTLYMESGWHKIYKQPSHSLIEGGRLLNIAVLGSTKGTDLQAVIDAIESGKLADVKISVVISNKQDAYILERARKHNIKSVFVDSANKTREEFDREIMKILDKENVGLVLLIGYMRFISREFVGKWRNKVINVHPSLLPKYAGGMDKNVHKAVLDAGEKETGMTIHFVDEGADTGPVILQKKCSIGPDETVDSLKEKVQQLEGDGFIEAIKLFRDNKLRVKGNAVRILK